MSKAIILEVRAHINLNKCMNKNFFLQLNNEINEHVELISELKNEKYVNSISQIFQKILTTIKKGNKIMLIGNGGSASDVKHFATELIVKFNKLRKPLPCISLTSDSTAITAIANDFEFKKIFSRQIEALYKKGDLVIAYSTSGNSNNILDALKFCKKKNIFTISILGNDGGKCKNYGNLELNINSKKVSRIQEMHYFINHYICLQLDKYF